VSQVSVVIDFVPKRSVALRARMVSALLVHHAHMHPQIARRPERSVALRARVVSALLVHSAHMRPQSSEHVPFLVVIIITLSQLITD